MKDPHSLPDVHLFRDSRGIELSQVGIRGLDLPFVLDQTKSRQTVCAKCALSVRLAPELRAVHMSRLVSLLVEQAREGISELLLGSLLKSSVELLQSDSARYELSFGYFINKQAPVSGLQAPMMVPCTLIGSLDRSAGKDCFRYSVKLEIPAANLCPCSKTIAEFGAHNQRVQLSVTVHLESGRVYRVLWLDELINVLEESASSPLYPLLKRSDEKFVTELQYQNPKFVEDVARDAARVLREYEGVKGFTIDVEAFESIHAHNAWASCAGESS